MCMTSYEDKNYHCAPSLHLEKENIMTSLTIILSTTEIDRRTNYNLSCIRTVSVVLIVYLSLRR
jgi:hypothetical protein